MGTNGGGGSSLVISSFSPSSTAQFGQVSSTLPVCYRVVVTIGISLVAGLRARLSRCRRQVVAMVLLKVSSKVTSPET
jgi:hypothetical protein